MIEKPVHDEATPDVQDIPDKVADIAMGASFLLKGHAEKRAYLDKNPDKASTVVGLAANQPEARKFVDIVRTPREQATGAARVVEIAQAVTGLGAWLAISIVEQQGRNLRDLSGWAMNKAAAVSSRRRGS